MKSESINQYVTMITNIGVLLGIVFLGYELQQNNDLLSAQARNVRFEARMALRETILQNDEVIQSIARANRKDELSDEDELRLHYLAQIVLLGWQSSQDESKRGTLGTGGISVDGFVKEMQGNGDIPRMYEAWDQYKNVLNPEFVKFMEDNVINQINE
jgi:hypothetical protein